MFNRPICCCCAALALAAGCARRDAEPAGDRGPPLEPDVQAALELLQGDTIAEALAALTACAARHPSNATVWANLGLAYWRQGEPHRALASLENAAALAPSDPRPLEFAARIRLDADDVAAARLLLDRANRRLAHAPRILTAMGVVEYRAGDVALAEAFFDQALAADASHPAALYNMAVLKREARRDTARVAALFEQYTAVADDDERLAEAHRYLAALRPAQAPPAPAVEPRPPPAVARPPASPPPASPPTAPTRPPAVAPRGAAAAGVAAARQALAEGAVDRALLTLRQVLAEDAEHPDALWEMAVLYREHLGAEERARVFYDRFAAAAPSDPRVGSIPAAARPAAGTDRATAWGRGLSAQRARRFEEAAAAYRDVLAHDVSVFAAWYNLGLVYKELGRHADAEQAFARAMALDPAHIDAAYMRAVALHLQERSAEALAILDPLLERRPEHVQGQYLAGLAHARLNQQGGARSRFRQVLLLDRDGNYGRSAQEWLDRNERRPPPRPGG